MTYELGTEEGQAGLYLVSKDGEIVSREPKLADALERIEELERDVANLEVERRNQRNHIARLKAELNRENRENYDRIEEVVSVFAEWAETCGHRASRLTNDRFDAVRALLEVSKPQPYPREAFTAAIAGAAYDPYCTTRKNGSVKRFDDLALVCRDGKTFEDFIKRAPRADA